MIGTGINPYFVKKGQNTPFIFSTDSTIIKFEQSGVVEEYYSSQVEISEIVYSNIDSLQVSTDLLTWEEISLPFSGISTSITGTIYWKATVSSGYDYGLVFIDYSGESFNTSCERGVSFTIDNQIVIDYHFSNDSIDTLIVRDIDELYYSLDGDTYTSVTLPYEGGLSMSGTVYWKVGLSTGKSSGYLYFNCNSYEPNNQQERKYCFNTDNLLLRDFYWYPVKVSTITSNIPVQLYFSYDGIYWNPLQKNTILFDNVWIRSNSESTTFVSIVGNLDQTNHIAGWLGGQSNALGDGLVSNDSNYTKKHTRVYICGNGSDYWDIMNPGVNDHVISLRSGPNCGFAKAFTDNNPNNFLFYYKNAVGGSSLLVDWLPISTGYYNSRITNGLFIKLQELVDRKVKFTFDFVDWIQGNADSGNLTRANAYYSGLVTFWGQFILDLQAFCTTNNIEYKQPVFIFGLPKWGVTGETYMDIIRNSISRYASEGSNMFTLDHDNYKYESETGVHHTIAELIAIGTENYNIYNIHR